MGVRGLTTYIFDNPELYLKPYKLSDCCLVIDGSNVAHALAQELKSYSAFGGDYDEYYVLVKNFLLGLKKCNIFPIVLMDGGYEEEKFKTRLRRRQLNVHKLRSFCNGFSRENFSPLLLFEVFVNAARDQGCICIQCDLEADREVAAVARTLNCPVLAYDSDYFMYDVLYISYNVMKHIILKYPEMKNKYYIECLIYDVNHFLKIVEIDKSLLPIIAALLGNDYVETDVFFRFFHHISYDKCKNKSLTQKRVRGVMQWLRHKDFDSAKKHILSHSRKKDASRISGLFKKTINDYSPSSIVSEVVFNELTGKFGNTHLLKSNFSINWPPEIDKLSGQTLIPNFVKNMVIHQCYFTSLQVENIFDKSSHFKCLILIKKIYKMVTPYLKKKKPLKLLLIDKQEYKKIELDTDLSDYVNLGELLKEPQETRLKFLCDLVGIGIDELTIVPSNYWSIFIMSFIYWVKEFKNSVSLAHIKAFVLMMIVNKVVQTKVGFYRSSVKFMNHYKNQLAKLKGTKLTLKESSDFQEMLKNVTEYECLLVQKKLIPFRQTNQDRLNREYCISTIHLFNCFQSCLLHIMTINALLNYPLPYLKVNEFYSGTLLFNLYINIKSKCNVTDFGSSLLLNMPNLNQIYKYLSEKLSKLLVEKSEMREEKVKKRKRRNRGKKE